MTSLCCKCMSSGVCIACSCVRQHRVCSNCYPSRIGCCRNISHHSTTSRAWSRSSGGDNDSEDHIGSCVTIVPCSQPSAILTTQPVTTLSSPQSPLVVELPSFRSLSGPHSHWNGLAGDECVE